MIWTYIIGLIIVLLLVIWGYWIIHRRGLRQTLPTKTNKKYYDLFIHNFPYALFLAAFIIVVALIATGLGTVL